MVASSFGLASNKCRATASIEITPDKKHDLAVFNAKAAVQRKATVPMWLQLSSTPGHVQARAVTCLLSDRRETPSLQHGQICAAAANTRRDVLFGACLGLTALQAPPSLAGMNRYIKTKKLDPLVSYIPVLLIAQAQLGDVPIAAEELGIEATRSLLRKGAFDGLRDNVRAVGEYAGASVGNSVAQAAVKRVFVSFDKLDQALLLAAREEEPKVPEGLGTLVKEAQAAIDALLETAPAEDVQRGRDVVEVIFSKEQDAGGDAGAGPSVEAQQEAKRLEGLL